MTTTCPRQNNVMQFLYVSKNCQVTSLKSSTFWKKSCFKFALNVFFMKKFEGAILSQNHRRSQGGGPGVKKSYFNPIFTNIFNKHLTNIFPKQTFFSKTFQNNFFPKQTFFPNFTKIAQRLGALPPDSHNHRRLGAPLPDPRL